MFTLFSSFQHIDQFKQTTHVLRSFSAHNSNLSEMQRTQGLSGKTSFQSFNHVLGSSFLCWAFSCASMLRASCSILIKKLFEAGKIDETTKLKCLEYINEPDYHRKIRNLISMILVPKKLHMNDDSQAAYLKAAVSRVSL